MNPKAKLMTAAARTRAMTAIGPMATEAPTGPLPDIGLDIVPLVMNGPTV